jgi:RNA polymerase sigma factor (sigma-70 family)
VIATGIPSQGGRPVLYGLARSSEADRKNSEKSADETALPGEHHDAVRECPDPRNSAMHSGPTDIILHHVRRLAFVRTGAGLADGELLRSFVTERDEIAFEELVRRHGPMVLGVCRRVLRNAHDAEDAFQATFLVLVRKAASLPSRPTLGDWLYGVAYHTALKAKATAARRRAKEAKVREMPQPKDGDELVWRELRPLLDRELNRLPARYRAPIVLCDLEEKTRKQAAAQLGWPEGTLSSRLARARALLARRLARHGLILSGGSLALLLAQNAASACVSAPLQASTLQAATLTAAGAAAGAVSTPVATLTQGVLNAMFLDKMKAVFKVVLALGIAGIGTDLLIHRVLAEKLSIPNGKDSPRKPVLPAKPVDQSGFQKPGSSGKAETNEVSGVVRSVDAARIALRGKQKLAQTFDVAPQAKVYLDDGSEGGSKLGFSEGRLSDITEGTAVTLRLSEDRRTVVRIWVEGSNVQGVLRAMNEPARTVTVAVGIGKGKTAREKTFRVANAVSVVLHGQPHDKRAPTKHQLADVPVGALVTLKLSAGQNLVTSIQAEGPVIHGTLKALDIEKSTITVDLQLGATKLDQTYTVHPRAWIVLGEATKEGKRTAEGGKLADIPVGAQVTLKLAPDQKAVVSLSAQGPTLAGTVKVVDVEKNSLTLAVVVRKGESAQEQSFNVAKDAALRIDGKDGKLAALPRGAVARIRLSTDQKSVVGVEAEGTGSIGIVKAVDATNGRITFVNKLGEHNFAVAKDAQVFIDGREGRLENVPVEASVTVKLTADQTAVLTVAASGPSVQGILKGVDAPKKTITVAVRVGKTETEDRTFDVAPDAQVVTGINGVPLALADLKAERMVVLELSADRKAARRIVVLGE